MNDATLVKTGAVVAAEYFATPVLVIGLGAIGCPRGQAISTICCCRS